MVRENHLLSLVIWGGLLQGEKQKITAEFKQDATTFQENQGIVRGIWIHMKFSLIWNILSITRGLTTNILTLKMLEVKLVL